MIDPASGPFLFDTSAESYLSQSQSPAEVEWLMGYVTLFPVFVAVVTVMERARGYFLARSRCAPARRMEIESKMLAHIQSLNVSPSRVLNLTTAIGLLSAQMMTMMPAPPTPPVHSHRLIESRQDRLSRWRFDIMIAATALVHNLPLIHNNPRDFESLRALIETVPERFPGVGPLNLISVKRLAS